MAPASCACFTFVTNVHVPLFSNIILGLFLAYSGTSLSISFVISLHPFSSCGTYITNPTNEDP